MNTSKKTPKKAAKETASKANKRDPFTMGDLTVLPGKSGRLELPIARLTSGAMLSVPIAIAHGGKPGPTIWISAAIHGDELNGIAIIRRVLAKLSPRNLAGTVVAVPVVNVFGLINESRYLPDRRDLNRSFPGSKRGSLAAQLAHLFIDNVVQRCDFGIDLHTGSAGRFNLPQIRCDVNDSETKRLAEAFAAPVTLHSDLRDGSLRAASRELGKPILLYEGGEASRFDGQAINMGVAGILRVMAKKGMLDTDIPYSARPSTFCHSSEWVRARRSGFCQLKVLPGDRVEAGQELALIFDALGRDDAVIRAKHDGILIGCQRDATVHQGDAVAHIALL